MGQIGFGRGAREVELGHPGAERLELGACFTDHDFLGVGGDLQRAHAVVEAVKLLAQGIEGANLVVERRLPFRDRIAQIRRPLSGGRQLAGHDRRSRVELGGYFLETLHLGGHRRGTLDQRRVGGAGVGRPPAQVERGFTRFEQAALRQRQALVGRSLIPVEPFDRSARFGLTAFEGRALLLRLPPLARQLLGLLLETRQLVRHVLQL